ncbi:MAG: DNA helicase UvrBC [Rhodopirellula sp.]|nr:DNA helicase UvrBC [Rhodopirellula sp.]|tara:strand:+ start:6953 stop:7684 length:732 start_codon:yes stop_codon:yes gene_type:complete
MADFRNISDILQDWDYDSQSIRARIVAGQDGEADVLQMRVEMGIIQMAIDGRPDGIRPEGFATYLDYLLQEEISQGNEWDLNDEQCMEVDREFMQFYQRRISWLSIKEYQQVVRDADHTLALMDFCKRHSPDDGWTIVHEQYRPFVLFHRTQAAAYHQLNESTPQAAIECINDGLNTIRSIFESHDLEEHFDEDELVSQLRDIRESLRDEYSVGKTLHEQLADAIASEQYERAAEIRDQLSQS